MDPSRKERAEEIFLDALDVDAQERDGFVVERCGSDPELLGEVRALLAAHRALGILERGAPQMQSAPESVGPYRLLEVIGEGGMGQVWLAEQREPVRRRVALKIIKLGMDTREVVARFESERQALAMMDHPGIARVLDAGATDTGRPYFVMELVKGVPITEYCDAHRFTTSQRIELFADVCRAVQHAHLKGVIHRDLKPSNVLITEQDGRPVPKVIDFGIAKAVHGDLTDSTLVTRLGQLVGTPAYMSPEQAGVTALDVDTRADVYSLGVLLYELLVGTLPIDMRAVADAALRSAIQDTDVPRPSTRLTSLGADQETVASYRRTSAIALRKELRDDLDWIILKAMEKDRSRRYETPGAFADDLERRLSSEPVVARPPSTAYRAGKFVRRHRTGVALVALAFVALSAFGVTVSVQSQRIARERDKAVQVSEFLEDLFAASDPFANTRRDTLNIGQFVALGAERVREELADQPEVQAQMLTVLGRVHRNLGQLQEARALLEEALELWTGLRGEESRESLGSRQLLAFTLGDMGELDEAEAQFRRTIEGRRDAGLDRERGMADALTGMGNVLQNAGRFQEAESYYRQGLEVARTAEGVTQSKIAANLNNLGTILVRTADYEQAEPLLREAVEIGREELGDNHPTLSSYLNNLAYLLEELGQVDEAEALHREALAIARNRFGAEHAQIARSLNNLAVVLINKGEYEEAEPLLAEAVEMRRSVFGPRHQAVGLSLSNLASVQRSLGRLDEAEASARESLAIIVGTVGPDHPRVAGARLGLANIHHEQGEHADAVEELELALDIRRGALTEGHPLTANVLTLMGRCLTDLARYSAAETALLEALSISESRRDENEESWRRDATRLAELYEAWGQPAEAERYRDMLGAQGRRPGPTG
jgi:non-specific serine/threonine protein kinase/serine/threonine-protein kinase